MRAASGGKQADSQAIGRAPGAQRAVATALMLAVGLLLSACAGTANEDSFSAYVADHWPHWAGGMPGDVPPRPGAPGYNEFIAHGQADQEQAPPAGANGTAAPVTPVFQTTAGAPAPGARVPATTAAARLAPAPIAAQAAPQPAAPAPVAAQAAPEPAADDTSVVHGGLY